MPQGSGRAGDVTRKPPNSRVREYVKEARRRMGDCDFYSAGILYHRAANRALRAKKQADRYYLQAMECFEKGYQSALEREDYAQAADCLERMAKILERRGDTQKATTLRLRASDLRLKGITAIMR